MTPTIVGNPAFGNADEAIGAAWPICRNPNSEPLERVALDFFENDTNLAHSPQHKTGKSSKLFVFLWLPTRDSYALIIH
jgi:hypothetical protein